jgi:pimeloyl-ACP methyl ester carboxylesterase
MGIAVVLAGLLMVNTVVVNNQTKAAKVTVEGGRIVSLPGGNVQVLDEGPTAVPASRAGAPIVLVHCYSCSLRWWDAMVPLLSKEHRVVRIDLLGHGGSEKPKSGYSIESQAQLVAGALNELGVEGAVVVGHSLGATVVTALAEQSSQLVDRVVNIDQAPDNEDFGDFPLIAKLSYWPVIGEALTRITPDFAIKDGYQAAFAPDYDLESGFEDPDQVVADLHAMTNTAFESASEAEDDYTKEIPLDDRLARAAVPLLVIFGSEDQVYEPATEALAAYRDVPGVRTALIDGAGHSPNVEKPEEAARLILEFAADAGDEGAGHPPRRVGLGGRKAKGK